MTNAVHNRHITRAQLRGYGLSNYLVRRVTAGLTHIAKRGNAHCFALSTTMSALREYAEHPRVRPATRMAIQHALRQLSPLLGNVITAQFGMAGDDRELRDAVIGLLGAQQTTDRALADLKATAAEIRGRTSR